MTATHQFKVVSAFLIIYFVWGSTYLAIRLTLDAVPAFFSMGLRFFIAAVLIFIWIKPGKIRQVTLKQAINSLAVGFMLMGLGTGPVAWAVRYVPTGVTAMIIAVLPVWFVLFEKLLKNRAELGVVSCVGIGISIAGSLLLMGITDINAFTKVPLLPFLVILISCFFWAFASVWGSTLEKPEHNFTDVAIQMAGGVACNLMIGLFLGEYKQINYSGMDFTFVMAVLYLSIFGSVLVYGAYNFLIKHINTALVATHSYVNPIVAVFLGWLFLEEIIDTRMILSSLMVLSGVTLIRVGYRKSGSLKIKA